MPSEEYIKKHSHKDTHVRSSEEIQKSVFENGKHIIPPDLQDVQPEIKYNPENFEIKYNPENFEIKYNTENFQIKNDSFLDRKSQEILKFIQGNTSDV